MCYEIHGDAVIYSFFPHYLHARYFSLLKQFSLLILRSKLFTPIPTQEKMKMRLRSRNRGHQRAVANEIQMKFNYPDAA